MKYYVYVLYSPALKLFYKGQTNDLHKRIIRHNCGLEKATKHGVPWSIVWFTIKKSRSEAMILERKLKNLSRARLLQFIRKYHSEVNSYDDVDMPRIVNMS